MPNRRFSQFIFVASLLLCVCPVFAFSQGMTVATTITALTVHPGDSGIAVPFTLTGGTGPVTVTITGLPSGISVAPVTLSGSGSGTLVLAASVAAGQEGFPASSPANSNTYTTTPAVVAVAASQVATAPFSLTVSLSNPAFTPAAASINLPIVRINTGGVAVTSKAVNVPGTITITSANGQTAYLPGLAGTDNTATFHVHGFSTSLMPKLPYNVKLTTSTDLLSGMGLQCGYVGSSGKAVCDKSKSYILLANYDDKTMLRDWSASALANAIPIGGAFLNESANSPTPSGSTKLLPWASHSLYVELFLNGQYEGTYQLIEEVKADSHRVNITEMAQTTISGAALTGGYLMEIDQHMAEDFLWTTPSGLPFGLLDPDYTPEVPEQTSYIQNYVNAADTALHSPTFTSPTTGWRAYFDQASLVNFYLVNDILGNVDGGDFYSSNYLYKNVNNPLIYMGPVWDFDISSGNVNYFAIVNPTIPWITAENQWYPQLFKDPTFKQAAQQQWNALKSSGILSSWLASIPAQAATLEQTQQNNFNRWPMQGILVWPNPQAAGSYDAEVTYLLDWINLRIGYIDAFLNQLPASTTTLALPTGTLRAGTAASLTASVSGASPTGAVTFTCNTVVVGQAPLGSNGMATLTTTLLPPGSCVLNAYYNGDANNAYSASAATNVSVLPNATATATNLQVADLHTYNDQAVLTAAVVPTTGGTPTGTVVFSVNGVVLGSSPVSATGIASVTTSQVPAGMGTLLATYSGDSTFAASTSNSVAVAVAQAAPMITWPQPAPIVYGTALSATQLDASANIPGTLTYNPSVNSLLGAGTYPLAATFTPADSNHTSAAASVSLTVAKQPTSALLTASAIAIGSGQPVTLSAGVLASLNGAPTGSVSFYDGSTLLGTSPLSAGSAAVTAPNLAVGLHLITASYSGDSNYLGAQSAVTSVNVGSLGFSLRSNSSSTLALVRGGSASVQLTLSPTYGTYPGPVTLTVSGLPASVQSTLNPASVAATAGTTSVTLMLTNTSSAKLERTLRGAGEAVLALIVLSPVAARRMRRRGWSVLLLFAVAAGSLSMLGLAGCGSSSVTPVGTYQVIVTASSQSQQQSVTTTVTVQ